MCWVNWGIWACGAIPWPRCRFGSGPLPQTVSAGRTTVPPVTSTFRPWPSPECSPSLALMRGAPCASCSAMNGRMPLRITIMIWSPTGSSGRPLTAHTTVGALFAPTAQPGISALTLPQSRWRTLRRTSCTS